MVKTMKKPVQQEMMNNFNPPDEKQLDLDQSSAQNPQPGGEKLQAFKEWCADPEINAMADRLAREIEEIKKQLELMK